MTFDAVSNFALTNIATPPSPATSGTSLAVNAGTGVLYPAAPFNAVVWPEGPDPTTANAEVIRVTAIVGDTFTIVRNQEGSLTRTILAGDQIGLVVTAKTITDIQGAINALATSLTTGAVAITPPSTGTTGLTLNAITSQTADLIDAYDASATLRFQINAAGNALFRATSFFVSNIQVGSSSADVGGGSGVISIKSRATAPTTNPTGGLIFYVESSLFKYRDPTGAVYSVVPQLDSDGSVSIQGTNGTQQVFIKSTSTTAQALTVYQADNTGGTVNSALNVVSDNFGFSTVQVTGVEKNRGTIKVAHKGYSDGSDSSAAALSIDLQTVTGGANGTAAQGIFITSTTGQTTGNIFTGRINGRDDFVVKGTGKVGIRIVTGATPGGALEIAQGDDSTIGLFMKANSSSALNLVTLKDSGGTSQVQVDKAGLMTLGQQLSINGSNVNGMLNIVNAVPTTGNPGNISVQESASTNGNYAVFVSGDSNARCTLRADGRVQWGPGNAALDTNLYRSAVGVLKTDGSVIVATDLNVAGRALGAPQPALNGFVGWTHDPATIVNSTLMVNGTRYLAGVYVSAAATVTKIYWSIATVGATPTASQNVVGLYNSSGTLLASTVVDSSITATGLVTTTITSQALTPGFYWVGFVFNASTAPTLWRGSGNTGVDTTVNAGLTAATKRFAINGTGQTTLATITPSANAACTFAGPWAAIG